jgi:hypothetical protein
MGRLLDRGGTSIHLLFTFMERLLHVSLLHMCLIRSMLSIIVKRRHTMWIIELNVAGHQFTHRVPEHRRSLFRFNPRSMGWRPAQLRNPHAA